MTSLVRTLARSGLLRDGLDHHLVRASMVLIFVLFGYHTKSGNLVHTCSVNRVDRAR